MESSVIREYTDIEPHESLRVEEIKLEPEIKYDTFYEEEEEIESGLSHKVKCEGLHKVNQETSQRVKIETGELASSQKMSNEVKIEIKDDIETEVLHDREVRSEVLHEVKTETFQNTNFTFCHVEIKSEPQYDETQFNLSCWEDYKDSSCIPNYSQELQKNIQGIKLENIDPHKLRKKQSDIRRKFNCDDCGTCFGLKQNLRRHVELNFCTEKFCVDCGKFFNRKESLENHMIRTHNKTLPIEIGVKCYECDVCKNRFVDKLTLETHVLEHKERKPLICHLCEKHFIRRYTFHRHLKMHNALKYKCDECNIGFSHKTRLIEHSAYHRALRPYQCAFCDKCFKEKAVYERHVNLHKGIRSFHCTMCNKLFTDNWILKRHLLIHQGIKYYCGECDRDFKCKGNLRLHLLTHEGERTSK